jgi:hypothetical protein
MKSTGRAEKPRSTGHHSIAQTVVRELTAMATVSTSRMWVLLTKPLLSPNLKIEQIIDLSEDAVGKGMRS